MKSPTETLRGLFGRRNDTVADAMVAPAETLPLPDLLLAAEKIATGLYAGVHGRRRSGAGEDFWQFRQYRAGEPATSIDWRQSARAPIDQTYWVRERERENAQSLLLWCDPSASMNWRSSTSLPTKREQAQLSTLALASSALRGGERVGLLTGPEAGRTFAGRHVLPRLGEALLHPSEHDDELPDILRVPNNADLVIVSDFLWEEKRIDALLKQCAGRPVRVHMLCILDPAERALPYAGRIRFEGLEGGVLTLPAVETLDAHYDRIMQNHLDSLIGNAASVQADCIIHTTGQDPLPALLALVMAMGSRR
ncbi:DUF58 domain-containing protein [Gluconobacter wancherniae]|uniref:DUF58 domain-containing protein n=1 Tax=Gluconobacter wancherniae NBRC 103581 TaxID=656744 RepID=A0A511B3L8_9PROT|nr:DUF58 domain-containing protein [Gluconobacter wancherniae]MBF0853914.1 DUF58 domain-containing protein [Gluconobacter wancherniae]GBD56969.1 hypothetical protein NBRC103581_01551 [Gluconobacter wancherniae NBRC 103581]GBR64916.1 hypothetical protein AA103581_1561 [Gluconobacter wancherniae NBRC 103581]GEK94263.1 hypothetical protein GWA01_20330 [Gluconobacter wancherniae NBRC 103581]